MELTILSFSLDSNDSPQIQNELIKVMAVNVLRVIVTFVQDAKFFSPMADEVTNVSNKEQVVVCLRSVDENLEPHKYFVGIHCVDSIEADTQDTLIHTNITVEVNVMMGLQICVGLGML